MYSRQSAWFIQSFYVFLEYVYYDHYILLVLRIWKIIINKDHATCWCPSCSDWHRWGTKHHDVARHRQKHTSALLGTYENPEIMENQDIRKCSYHIVSYIYVHHLYLYYSRSYIDTTTFIHVYASDYMVENFVDSWFLSSTSAAINVGSDIPP